MTKLKKELPGFRLVEKDANAVVSEMDAERKEAIGLHERMKPLAEELDEK
jgi:hypothetical protein